MEVEVVAVVPGDGSKNAFGVPCPACTFLNVDITACVCAICGTQLSTGNMDDDFDDAVAGLDLFDIDNNNNTTGGPTFDDMSFDSLSFSNLQDYEDTAATLHASCYEDITVQQEHERLLAERKLQEQEFMLGSATGRAWKLAEEIVKLQKLIGNPDINPIGADDIVFLAEKFIEQQNSFAAAKKNTSVCVAYHYTKKQNLDGIRQDGLMCSRERRTIDSQYIKRSGTFGDGVYTGNNPHAFLSYGTEGLMVAILKGRAARVNNGGLDRDASLDTGVGNKLTRHTRSPDPRNLEPLFDDETVLKRASQVLPLLVFPSGITHHSSDQLWHCHVELQKLLDNFFNAGKHTFPHRIQRHSRQKTPNPSIAQLSSLAASSASFAQLPSSAASSASLAHLSSSEAVSAALQSLRGRAVHNHGTRSFNKHCTEQGCTESATIDGVCKFHFGVAKARAFAVLNPSQPVDPRRYNVIPQTKVGAAYNFSALNAPPAPSSIQFPSGGVSLAAVHGLVPRTFPLLGVQTQSVAQASTPFGAPAESVLAGAQTQTVAPPSTPFGTATEPVLPGAQTQSVASASTPFGAATEPVLPLGGTSNQSNTQVDCLVYFAPQAWSRRQAAFQSVAVSSLLGASQTCPICITYFASTDDVVRVSRCHHLYHRNCINEAMKQSTKCIACGCNLLSPLGKSPSGYMNIITAQTPEGLSSGCLSILYNMQGGIQESYHDNPGTPFGPISRKAYLPDSEEGRKLLKRLKYAFLHGLTFTVGNSIGNFALWASISHITSLGGGNVGFPDPGYVARCNAELDAVDVPSSSDL